jgi:hypothetical protein
LIFLFTGQILEENTFFNSFSILLIAFLYIFLNSRSKGFSVYEP